MKKTALTLILFFSILLLSSLSVPTTSVHAQSNCTACSVKVDRLVSTSLWGTVVMNDTFTVNSGTLTQLLIGWPSNIGASLRNVTTIDSSKNQLTMTKLTNATTQNGVPYVAYDVAIPSQQSSSYTFTVASVFTHLLAYNQTATSPFTLSFSPFPVTDLDLNQATLTVKTSDWTGPAAQGVSGTFGNAFSTTPQPVRAYNLTTAKITFTSSAQLILDSTAARTIDIKPNANVLVTDSYTATNKGPKIDSSRPLLFSIPKDATLASVSDSQGRFDDQNCNGCVTSTPEANQTTVKVKPRFGAMNTNDTSTISVQYKLGPSSWSSVQPGKYRLNFSLFDNPRFYADSVTTRIITPSGFRLDSLNGRVHPKSSNGNEMIFETNSVSPASNLGFDMTYALSPFWASLTPLGWMVILEVAIVFGALLLRPGAQTVVVTGQGPAQTIKRFVNLYDEKSSLRREADRIEEDMNRGALNRHEYKRRRRLIDIRMAEIDRSLVPLKAQLADSGGRFPEMVRRVDRAEADLQVVRTSLADVRNQYRSARMTRDVYDSLTADLLRRKERAQQTIDNVVITLREESR